MVLQIGALLVLAAFYGCYYGKMMQQKKQGIQTDQLGKGKQGMEKWIELTMKVVTILVPATEVVSIVMNTAPLPVWLRWVGLALGVLGVTVFVASVLTMKDSWRAGVSSEEKTALVTKGIYCLSRNPAFLGFDLVYASILLMFFNWPLFVLSTLAAMLFHLQIVKVEEPFLAMAFGESYLAYSKQVRRYFGRKA